jgi:hypothetical protein
MSDIVPRDQLNKRAVQGVGAVVGGVALLVLGGGGVLALIAGGVVTVVGLLLMSSRSDRRAGVIATVIGGAALASGILGFTHVFGWVHWLMRAAGIVLVGIGGFSLFRFFSGLRKRM